MSITIYLRYKSTHPYGYVVDFVLTYRLKQNKKTYYRRYDVKHVHVVK